MFDYFDGAVGASTIEETSPSASEAVPPGGHKTRKTGGRADKGVAEKIVATKQVGDSDRERERERRVGGDRERKS